MAYDILHRHGNYGIGGKATYIKMGPFPTKQAAIAKRKTLDADNMKIVPHSKVKKHPLSNTNKSFKGLYTIEK